MILLDANMLLYAHDQGSARHDTVRHGWSGPWRPNRTSGSSSPRSWRPFGSPRMAASTSTAREPTDAIAIIEALLARPNVSLATPSDRHWRQLTDTAAGGRVRGPDLMDAHLTALAIEHGAVLATSDRGFARFPGLRTVDLSA